jgi:hypothetical protein
MEVPSAPAPLVVSAQNNCLNHPPGETIVPVSIPPALFPQAVKPCRYKADKCTAAPSFHTGSERNRRKSAPSKKTKDIGTEIR